MAIIVTLVGLDGDHGFTLSSFVVGANLVLVDVDLFFHIWCCTDRARTCDRTVNSRLLCLLSYCAIFGGLSRTRTEDYPVMSGGL